MYSLLRFCSLLAVRPLEDILPGCSSARFLWHLCLCACRKNEWVRFCRQMCYNIGSSHRHVVSAKSACAGGLCLAAAQSGVLLCGVRCLFVAWLLCLCAVVCLPTNQYGRAVLPLRLNFAAFVRVLKLHYLCSFPLPGGLVYSLMDIEHAVLRAKLPLANLKQSASAYLFPRDAVSRSLRVEPAPAIFFCILGSDMDMSIERLIRSAHPMTCFSTSHSRSAPWLDLCIDGVISFPPKFAPSDARARFCLPGEQALSSIPSTGWLSGASRLSLPFPCTCAPNPSHCFGGDC